MHVVVTGASRGIGAAIARRYAADGASLTLVARGRERLDAFAAELGRPTFTVATDLADVATAAAWVPEAVERLGPIDVLVNNAGRQVVGATLSTPVESGLATVALDLLTPMALTAAVGAGMVERGAGLVVNIASAAAFAWVPGMVYYNAAKSGLAAYSESLRPEWAPRGVHVLTVYPGPIPTDLAEEAMVAYGRMARLVPAGSLAGLADAVVRAGAARRPRVVYPAPYAVTRMIPNFSRWFTGRFAPAPQPGDSDR